ncbi:Glucose oxidase [Venustampulla echinocandica]|uniref:Glucose oxidase n=1 Tax=Venustampulla echinocandica TaxID=2656787 RepID=A0A370TT76_9HELO|nr:Glucose oxidase [Venustampulla echinocandica]RDL38732.1 Glucose oxidase [Venustampulla echinocandica]
MRSLTRITALGVFWATICTTAAKPVVLQYANVLQRSEQVKDSYDYVIVGGGTAGLTIADRLTEDGKYSVLVIEYCTLITDEVIAAGGGRNFNDPKTHYNITSIPQKDMNNRTQDVRIGCCVGGSSAINGMVMVRGTASEYNGWAELGGPESTWNWDGVLPYFKKAIHFTPPQDDVAAAFNITWDPNAWGQEPNTHIYATFPTYQTPNLIPMYKAMAKMPGMDIPIDGVGGNNGLFWNPTSLDPKKFWRSYSRTGHYDDITRPNYEVIVNNKVNKILFDGTTATGVQFTNRYDDDPTPVTVKANKEVIISAGTVHTPQILQLSGIGPKGLLESAKIPVVVDLPGVGQNFQDHAWLSVAYRWGNGQPPAPNVTLSGDPGTVAGPNVGAWIGLPAITNDFESIAARYEAQDPAAYLPANSDPTIVAGYAAFQKLHVKLLRSKNANFLWLPLRGSPGGIVMSMHVVSHGTINIDPANPNAEPIVDYRAFSNPIDMDIMVENINYMRKYMNSPDLAEYQAQEVFPGSNVTGEALKDWIRANNVPSNYHPIATASKKPLELGGVVDEHLKVHGTKRLSIADGSIMPLLPGANTQQTVYMLAEKAVDMIKARTQ